jgi:hypothetical protein
MAAPMGAAGEGPSIRELMLQGDQIATHKCVALAPRPAWASAPPSMPRPVPHCH